MLENLKPHFQYLKNIEILLNRHDYGLVKEAIFKVQYELLDSYSMMVIGAECAPEKELTENIEEFNSENSFIEVSNMLETSHIKIMNKLSEVILKYNQATDSVNNFVLSKVIDCAFEQIKEIIKLKINNIKDKQ